MQRAGQEIKAALLKITCEDHLWGKHKIPSVTCWKCSYSLTSPPRCKQSSNSFTTVLRSVPKWPLLQSTNCKAVFGQFLFWEGKYSWRQSPDWRWEQYFWTQGCTTYCFFTFLHTKSNRYKATLKLFSQTAGYVKGSVLGKNKYRNNSCSPRTATTLWTQSECYSNGGSKPLKIEVRWSAKGSLRAYTCPAQTARATTSVFFKHGSSHVFLKGTKAL